MRKKANYLRKKANFSRKNPQECARIFPALVMLEKLFVHYGWSYMI